MKSLFNIMFFSLVFILLSYCPMSMGITLGRFQSHLPPFPSLEPHSTILPEEQAISSSSPTSFLEETPEKEMVIPCNPKPLCKINCCNGNTKPDVTSSQQPTTTLPPIDPPGTEKNPSITPLNNLPPGACDPLTDPKCGFQDDDGEEQQLKELLNKISQQLKDKTEKYNEETKWLTGVKAMIRLYSGKAKTVEKHTEELNENINDLKKKTAQVHNLILQHRLEKKLREARSDHAAINALMPTVKKKLTSLESNRMQVKDTIGKLQSELANLSGETDEQKKEAVSLMSEETNEMEKEAKAMGALGANINLKKSGESVEDLLSEEV